MNSNSFIKLKFINIRGWQINERRNRKLYKRYYTELLTGFYVKWGDDATDIEPILHLYKTEVYKLARELNIPDKIIQKAPSPDLIPGVTDEYALGMSYSQLDRILTKIEKGNGLQKEDKLKVQRVMDIMEVAKSREIKMIGLNEYKLKKLMGLERKEG